tara:strand:+ start:457 stop:753 length:297 start_codon:yes stop_codon:yes gene_type:complete
MQEPDENKIILNFLLSGSCILDMAHHILCEGSAVLPVTEETNMAKKHDIIVPIILARIHEDGMSFDDASASAKGYYRKSVAELEGIRRDDRAARTTKS